MHRSSTRPLVLATPLPSEARPAPLRPPGRRRSWRATRRSRAVLAIAAFGVALGGLGPGEAQLSSDGTLLFSQDPGSLAGDFGPGERFGTALAVADLDGDGDGDLLIGVPGDLVPGDPDPLACGRLQIASWDGGALEPGSQLLRLDDFPALGQACADGDRFGESLAVGRFSDRPYPEIAIGIPYRTVGAEELAGAVLVLANGPSGPIEAGALYLTQSDVGETPEAHDKFGQVLAVGNFDADAWDDLVIGVIEEDTTGGTNVGMIHLVPGSADGLDPASARTFAWPEIPNGFGLLGQSFAVGDFDGDEVDDLAFGSTHVAGRVFVMHGNPGAGLSTAGLVSFTQDQVSGSPAEHGDRFGASLAAGDFDGDGISDLAIGARSEDDDTTGVNQSGLVHVVHGSETGLVLSADAPNLTFSELDVGGTQSDFDSFGRVLAVGDLDGDGISDLILGIPLDDASGFDEGFVVTVSGRSSVSLDLSAAVVWRQGEGGLLQDPFSGDELGFSLATGPLGLAEGADDLVFGAPGDSVDGSGPRDHGVVHVLFGVPGLIHADGFESGDADAWD